MAQTIIELTSFDNAAYCEGLEGLFHRPITSRTELGISIHAGELDLKDPRLSLAWFVRHRTCATCRGNKPVGLQRGRITAALSTIGTISNSHTTTWYQLSSMLFTVSIYRLT